MCNVYRRFVFNIGRTAAPLNALLQKGNPAVLPPFREKHRVWFNLSKEAEASCLRSSRTDLPFSVGTDAFEYQICRALVQEHEEGSRCPIGFWSCSLSAAEKNYSVGEKKCLTVRYVFQILRPCLQRKHTVLHTDHQALKWLLNLSDASSRLARKGDFRLLEF